MAYVNVAEWNPEHVADWLRGKYFSVISKALFTDVYLLVSCGLLVVNTALTHCAA